MVMMHKNQDFMLQQHYISAFLIQPWGGQFFTAAQQHISEDCRTGNPCFMPTLLCLFALISLANLHNFLIYALIFILIPLVGCILGCRQECMKIIVQNKAWRQYTHCKLHQSLCTHQLHQRDVLQCVYLPLFKYFLII